MGTTDSPGPPITLQPLAGPPLASFTAITDGPVALGRGSTCEFALLDDGVSRRHALLVRRRGEWFLIDEGSSAGTYINGVRVPRQSPAPLATGDLLRIGPWVFRVVVGEVKTASASTVDDVAPSQRIERPGHDRSARSDRRLRLLGEAIGRLNAAPNEDAAARTVLDSALRGTGYARGAVLRRPRQDANTGAGLVEIVCVVRADPNDDSEFRFSRSLLDSAAAGETVVLTEGRTPANVYGQSLAELEIHSALCVPVMLGGSVTGHLYLDARGRESSVRPDAAGFCEALAIAYGLAVASLHRAELERRQAELQAELSAAREVQQLVMPPGEGTLQRVEYAVRSQPGSFVAGDLFDALAIPGGRVAVCLGDVSGHGVGAAMLMATAQAYLHGELHRLEPAASPVPAVAALNRFLCERALGGRFMSLWVGVIDSTGRVEYVDAGHGHWLRVLRDGTPVFPPPHGADGGVPVGIDADAPYAAGCFQLGPGERLIIYSDGIVEQRGAAGEAFGAARLYAALRSNARPRRDIEQVFAELLRFMTTPMLDDDATAASFSILE